MTLTPGQIVIGKLDREYEVRSAAPFLGYYWLREVGRSGTIVPHRPQEIVVKGRVG